jgi:hypothetical protein
MNALQGLHTLRYAMAFVISLAGAISIGYQPAHAGDDPLNVPLESLGATGYDKTLCSDRWNTCTKYDRQQFDQRYPGRPLEELSLYPPARGYTEGYGSREKRQEFDGEYRSPSDFHRRNKLDRSDRP